MADPVSVVDVVMGSQSDWPTMCHAKETLQALEISVRTRIVSAHRTPERLYRYAKNVLLTSRAKVIIAGAGGAAHLPGMIASLTHLPVIGVPVQSHELNGLDSLLSIVQMPAGVPVATMKIGKAGAVNAALFAARICALSDDALQDRLLAYIRDQTNKVAEVPDERIT